VTMRSKGGGSTSMVRWSRCIALLIGLTIVAAALPTPAAAQDWAPPPTVYLDKTGHTLDRLFLDLWREHPELLGNPITEEMERSGVLGLDATGDRTVQYFDNAALVYLDDRDPGDQVRLLDLGRQALERERDNPRPSTALVDATRSDDCDRLGLENCLDVDGSGHTVRHGFKTFWEETGGEVWIGKPLTEEFRASGGTMVQYFENAVLRWRKGGQVAPRPLGQEEARRAELDTKRIERPDGLPEYDPELFVAPPEPVVAVVEEEVSDFGPGPQQGGYQEIVISISAQRLWAYEADEMVLATYVSTGTADVPETVTPIGFHQVLAMYDMQTMEGTISNEYYNVPDVPWVMYFDNLGNALHGTYWHNNFGTPMSHGCVNLPLDVAEWMYSWVSIGTPVTVVG